MTCLELGPVVVGWILSGSAGSDGAQPQLPDPTETTAGGAHEEGASGAGDAPVEATIDDSSSADAGLSDDSVFGGSESDTESSTTASDGAWAEHDDEIPGRGAPEPEAVRTGKIDPFDGRFGVGAIRTIAGLNGINMRYFITDKLAIGGSAGVALFAYGENDPESDDVCPGDDCTYEDRRTVAALGFNIEMLYFAHLGREAGALPFRADFGVGGRFGLLSVINASDIEDNLDDPTELHIEIPLIFQLMFGNNFALSPELGMDFRITPGSREEGDSNVGAFDETGISPDAVDGPGFGWDLTSGIGLFAGASMHYYFGR